MKQAVQILSFFPPFTLHLFSHCSISQFDIGGSDWRQTLQQSTSLFVFFSYTMQMQ
jgi:hypothetical protein